MTKGKVFTSMVASVAFAATAYAANLAPSEQIQVLAHTVNSGQEGGWFVRPEHDANWNRWFYAVTDLDHDGRLEIFKAKRGGDGVAPELRCEELNDNCDARTWGLFLVGGSDVPDIMSGESSSAPMMYYEQASNDYHYVFVSSKEEAWDDWDFTDMKVALTLHGDLTVEELAFMKVKMESPYSDMATRKFFLPGWLKVEAESGETGTPEEIDLQRYADIELARFGVESGQETPISWHRAEEIQELIGLAKLPLVLENSYKTFLNGGHYY
ncbi:MAG: hypothetical protein IJ521_02780 [Schwartzia sp.]|nr:hypothetical protein [Schwartzia sp. (in: firmicutes)]